MRLVSYMLRMRLLWQILLRLLQRHRREALKHLYFTLPEW